MFEFELKFEITPVHETTADRLENSMEAIFARHYGVATVSVVVAGANCLAAAAEALARLKGQGVAVVRLVDDVVGRSEIANRANVSRQAVANWISGKRQKSGHFPAPFILTDGGLWMWGEVLPALQILGYCEEDDLRYPSAQESQIIGAMIVRDKLARRERKALTWGSMRPVRATTTMQALSVPRAAPSFARLAVAA